MYNVACRMSRVACHMSHVACRLSYVVRLARSQPVTVPL